MPPDNILNGILADFTAAANGYFPLVLLYSVRILAAIVTLQICYLSIQAALRWDLMSMFEAFFLGFVRIALVWAVMDHLWDYANGFINTAEQIGADVSGQSPGTLTPSGVYDLGLSVIGQLYRARTFGMWLHPIDDIALMFVAIVTQLTFGAVGLLYLWTLLEGLYHIAKGPIVLCWSAFDCTWEVLARWAEKLLGLSIKILSTVLMLAVGIALTGKWSAYLNGVGLAINDHRIFYATLALIESLAFFAGAWIVPRMVAANIHANVGTGTSGDAGANSMWGMGQAAGAMAVSAAPAAAKGAVQLGKYIQGEIAVIGDRMAAALKPVPKHEDELLAYQNQKLWHAMLLGWGMAAIAVVVIGFLVWRPPPPPYVFVTNSKGEPIAKLQPLLTAKAIPDELIEWELDEYVRAAFSVSPMWDEEQENDHTEGHDYWASGTRPRLLVSRRQRPTKDYRERLAGRSTHPGTQGYGRK